MVFLDHVQNLHIHAEKSHKDSGAHCMNMLILYMVQKTHTAPYYRVQALFMCGVVERGKARMAAVCCVRHSMIKFFAKKFKDPDFSQ